MTNNEQKNRHDMARSIRHLVGLIDLIEGGLDFKTTEGQAVLKEAKQAREFLNSYLDNQDSKAKK